VNFVFQATAPVLKWEKKFMDMMENETRYAQEMEMFYEAGRR
jgi:hypothetical protein